MQLGDISLAGVWSRKNWCQADFQLSGSMPQFGINPGDAGNRRGIDFHADKHHHMICFHTQHNYIILAAKYGAQIPWIALKPCEYVCMIKPNICLISHVWIFAWHFFCVYIVAIFVAYPFCMHIVLTGCKILCANKLYNAQTSPNHGCSQMQNAKIGLSWSCFEKFGQGALLKLRKMLLHIPITSNLNNMDAKSCRQTLKNACVASQTVFTVKCRPQNSKFSCVCSSV